MLAWHSQALARPPASHKIDVVVYTYNPSMQEVKSGGSEVDQHPCLHGKFEVSLRYRRPCPFPPKG